MLHFSNHDDDFNSAEKQTVWYVCQHYSTNSEQVNLRGRGFASMIVTWKLQRGLEGNIRGKGIKTIAHIEVEDSHVALTTPCARRLRSARPSHERSKDRMCCPIGKRKPRSFTYERTSAREKMKMYTQFPAAYYALERRHWDTHNSDPHQYRGR